MARSCYILADYDCGQRLSLERREPCANAQLVREASGVTTTPGQGLRIKPERLPHTGSIQHFSVRVSWQESNPWSSGLRVICVTIKQSQNRGCTIA
jgi:hypothetical protein